MTKRLWGSIPSARKTETQVIYHTWTFRPHTDTRARTLRRTHSQGCPKKCDWMCFSLITACLFLFFFLFLSILLPYSNTCTDTPAKNIVTLINSPIFFHFFNKFTFSVIQVAFMDSAAGAQTSCWGSLTRACTLNTYTTSYSGCNYLNPSCAPLYKYQFVFYYWHS